MHSIHHARSIFPEINTFHHLGYPFILIRQRHASQRMITYSVRVRSRLNITFNRQDANSITFGCRYASRISVNGIRPARFTTRTMNSLNLNMIEILYHEIRNSSRKTSYRRTIPPSSTSRRITVSSTRFIAYVITSNSRNRFPLHNRLTLIACQTSTITIRLHTHRCVRYNYRRRIAIPVSITAVRT